MGVRRGQGPLCSLALALLLGAACASGKPGAQGEGAALAGPADQRSKALDEAHLEKARARDELSRARAARQEARAKVEVAHAQLQVSQAQQRRAQAGAEMLERQKADAGDVQRARQDAESAARRTQAAGLKIECLDHLVDISDLEEQIAAQRMRAAAASEKRAWGEASDGGSSDAAALDARVEDARAKEEELRKQAAERRDALVDSYNRWLELDALALAPRQAPR
jgi:hypothetical protein